MQSLPLHIFQYIQEFLYSFDYLQLMNTNKKLFSEIKRETVIYDFEWKRKFQLEYISYLEEMGMLVKDPKKQINLKLTSIPGENLLTMKFPSLYLHSLFLSTTRDVISFPIDFSIFNNIPKVVLRGFAGIKRIGNGLNNIRELTLRMTNCEEISGINKSNTLKMLHLEKCNNLKHFPSQQEENEIQQLISHPQTQLTGITFQTTNHNNGLEMNRLFTRYLQDLDLRIDFPLPHLTEECILLSIPNLSLSFSNGKGYHPVFPHFYGKTLHLVCFDLLPWNKQDKMFLYITSLELIRCINLFHLPKMPNLQHLTLFDTGKLESIPSFPKLVSLRLTHVGAINIAAQPCLKDIFICSCPRLTDFSNFDGQFFRSVSINDCDDFIDASPFRNCYELSLKEWSNVSKIPVFENNHSVTTVLNHRSLTLNNINVPFEFTKIQNLKYLMLKSLLKQQIDRIIIENIDDVEIAHCENYTGTENLHICHTKRLIIRNCDNLERLNNLQHTHSIILINLPNISDISGLGHHERMYVCNVPHLERCAKHFIEKRKMNSSFVNPDIFETIERFFVIRFMPELVVDGFDWDGIDDYESERIW